MTSSVSTEQRTDLSILANTRYDLSAGLVVFLVALPLCLGIALASGAPLFSGIIAGIVGGIIIPLASKSALSVSGPAAGLTAIVLMGIERLGGFEAFMAATVLAGLMQIGLGAAKAGGLGELVPTSVIKGMLAAIGLILILKQFPHATGYDVENFSLAFNAGDSGNTFTLLLESFTKIEFGALIISIISLVILFGWAKTPLRKITFVPPALVVVVLGVFINQGFQQFAPDLYLGASHLVKLPEIAGIGGFFAKLNFPDWSTLGRSEVYTMAVTIALVASIETLLCIEAVDRLDPFRRRTPTSRELVAQGLGNTVSGFIGGLPITSVIVRSSANVSSGGRTRMSAVYHGFFLLLAVSFLGSVLNLIPLACLAAILLQVGYKLARPGLFVTMYKYGQDQFVPFTVTVGAILLTDLLQGVIIGLIVGIIYVLRHKTNAAFSVAKDADHFALKFNKDVSFIHKPALVSVLREIPDDTRVTIDGSDADYVDFDITESIQQFLAGAVQRGIKAEVVGIRFRAEADGTPMPKQVRK
ncbi:MAG: SulP family inorganic anion transporter, partial [Myxococcota bacterium]